MAVTVTRAQAVQMAWDELTNADIALDWGNPENARIATARARRWLAVAERLGGRTPKALSRLRNRLKPRA